MSGSIVSRLLVGVTHNAALGMDQEGADALMAEAARYIEELTAVLQDTAYAIEQGNIYDSLCCSGHDCGCKGSSNADLAIHDIRSVLRTKGDAA